MRREIRMPQLSEEVTEGVVVTWFVEVGAQVQEGDLIAEVQVQKVSTEVRSTFGGRIAALLVEPGGVVAQGAVIAVLDEVGTASQPGPERAATARAPSVPPGASSAGGPVAPASPSARRLAQELGVDLGSVTGSGPGARIVEADLQAAAAGRAGEAKQASPAGSQVEPLSPMRRAIAARLQSWQSATAQLTLTAEVDVTALADQIERLGPGQHASYVAAAVRACALALRRHPRVGARWSDGGLIYPASIDIGIAVALAEGLITPVVREADGKDLETIGREIEDLAERARTLRLMPVDTEGGVFSVTNLGAYRIDAFTPLLNPPQTAILGLGRARRRPAVVGETITARTLLVLSLTFDHRVLDGAPAAAFLADVVESLEKPARHLYLYPRDEQ